MSNISINIPNSNQSSLSTLSDNYIDYFYYVFPLHLDTFKRLFGDVINAKLNNVQELLDLFKLFPSYILNHLIPLYNLNSNDFKFDFNYISNLLPSEPFYFEFIKLIKEHLNIVISKIDLTTTTDIINIILFFIVKEFDQNFQNVSNQISTKLNAHIGQIESNVKSIFNLTKNSLKIITSKIDGIKVDNYISNLDQNNSSLGKFDRYQNERHLIKTGRIDPSKLTNLGSIYLNLSNYKRLVRSCTSIKTNLNEFNNKLTMIKNISNQICQKINNYESNLPEINKIDELLLTSAFLKDQYINKLDGYKTYFNTLGQIGNHITYLKSSTCNGNLDDEFCNAVKSLDDIKLIPREINGYINNIGVQIDYIIDELQLIKLLLEYRDSIKSILIWSEQLLPFIKYKVIYFLKHSGTIIQTLEGASKSIQDIISQIEKISKKHSYLSRHVPEDLDTIFNNDISQIPQFIKDVSVYLRIVRYIIYNLEIIKSNSTKTIEEIKNKIEQMSDLSSSLKQLNEIYSEIIKFYYIHLKTTFKLIYYSVLLLSPEFQKSLRRFKKIIYETNKILYFVTLYYTILYHTNVIVKNMSELKRNIMGLKEFNKNFDSIRTFVSIIIKNLSYLNSNITELEKDLLNITANNLKDKIINYRHRVGVIRKNIGSIMKSFHFAKEYIDDTAQELKKKCKEITEEIQKSIVYLSTVILVQPFISLPMYIINSEIANQIFRVLSDIKKYLNLVKSHIELYIRNLIWITNYLSLNILILKSLFDKIILNIDIIDKSVLNFECTIEGVASNLILCTLKSNSNSVVKFTNLGVVELDDQVVGMYSMSNVMDYKEVVNRLLESAKKIDQILKLIPFPDGCRCILALESSNKIQISHINVQKIIENIPSENNQNDLKLDDITKIHELEVGGNHVCLCMIVKYILYPKVISICNFILGMDLDALSTLSRKFQKYADLTGSKQDIPQILILTVYLLDMIGNWIRNNYPYGWTGWTTRVEIKCYCTYNDSNYSRVISVMLVISYMIQNIVSMDNHDMRIAIECLSNFSSEFDIIDKDNTAIGWNVCKLYMYRIVINKICCPNQNPPCDPKCCCVTCLLIILMSVYVCISVKINNKLFPSKCDLIKKRICCFIQLLCNSKKVGNVSCEDEIFKKCPKVFCVKISDCCTKLLESCKQICSTLTKSDCNLEEWLKNCTQLCNGVTPCQPECICTKVKECLTELCKALNGEVEKLIQCIENCCKTDKCKWCGLKIVSYAIKVMRKNMVLIEYNMKNDIAINSIRFGSLTWKGLYNNIKSLYLCLNELAISLVKNNLITSSSHKILKTKDTIQSRNWGYDTHFEHELTTNSSSDNYPHINTRDGTLYNKSSSRKMFKLVLSRLLICALIVLMFVYLRISYQQFLIFNSSDLDIDNIDTELVNYTSNVDQNFSNSTGSSYLVDTFLNSNNYTTNYTSTETVPNEV